MNHKVYMVPNPPAPSNGMKFDAEKCIGCNRCVEVCPDDVFMPAPEKGQPPVVLYPEECWFCGGCIEECPVPGAITMRHPLSQNISVNWMRRETGKCFRPGYEKSTASCYQAAFRRIARKGSGVI